MEIIVPRKWTTRDLKVAAAKRDEYRHNRYTSGCAHLDDLVELGKAVILCPDHTRKFSPRKARYRAHPDRNMRRVIGNCDVCRQWGYSNLFLNEKDAYEEQKKLEKFMRGIEYATFT